MLHLGEVVLRAAVVGQQRAESDIHGDRDSDDGQRDQKELNGQGGRGDQWVASRVFALDEFVHEWESGARSGMPESVQVLPRESLAVKRRREASLHLGRDGVANWRRR